MQSQIDPELPEETSGPNIGKVLIARLRGVLGIARDESSAHGTAIEQLEIDIASKLDQSDFDLIAPILNQPILGKNGKQYKIVAGVIRNNNDGNGWRLITEPEVAKHSSLNIDSVTNNTSVITINYSGINAKKTLSFICGPDDTFQRAGLFVGASVTEASATIACHFQKKKVCDYISYNGSAWVSQAGVVTNFAFNAGALTITHPKVRLDSLGYDCNVTGRGTTYACQAGSISQTTTDITWTDWAGTLITTPNTNMRAFFSRGEASWDVISNENPSILHTGNYPGSNIWFIGIFEI